MNPILESIGAAALRIMQLEAENAQLRAALDSVLGLAEAQVMNTSNVPKRIYGQKLITDALALLRKEE